MLRFLGRRSGAAAVLLLILSFVIFVLRQISPGDPARAYLGANASREAVEAERDRLGLNDPFLVQYARFVWHALHGDLGRSLRTRHAVTTDLAAYLPASAQLVLAAFLLALVLASLFALSGALRWPGAALPRGILLLLATAPPFLLALAAVVVFYARLDWLPGSGRGDGGGDTLLHLGLPATVLAIAPAIAIGRIFRASLEATLHADHVRTARAKGLPEFRVLTGHVVRNSIGPALSMAGLQLGFMFAGVVVVEQVFSWPGIGNYLAASIPVADFPAVAGVTLVLGSVYIVSNAVVDLLQVAADPRIART